MELHAKRKKVVPAATLLLGIVVLWLVAVTAASTPRDVWEALERQGEPALALLRFQLPEEGTLPPAVVLTVGQSPLLTGGTDGVAQLRRSREADDSQPPPPRQEKPPEEDPIPETPQPPAPPLVVTDNGVPARTLCPSSPEGYLVVGRAYIRNTSEKILEDDLFQEPFLFPSPAGEGPRVLIYHTHTTEAYTPPPGVSYEATGECRTLDETQNVVQVGEALSAQLEKHGIPVLHDSTLHDWPEYSGSYGRSLKTVEGLLEEYPTIQVVLDLHRDAISDRDGNPFKVVSTVAGAQAAQMSLILGTDGGGLSHPHWQENLRLAAALQDRVEASCPQLMRPITLRNSRYNQHLSPGALLIEMGAAGNSLEEALLSAQVLGEALADLMEGGENP